MIRLALLAATSFALTACVGDQQTETSSTDQALTCGKKGYTCIFPTMWNPATQSTIGDFWAGVSTTSVPLAKVMIHVYTMGRSAADVGGGETQPSTYVFLVDGAPDGTNTFWKAVEVKGSDIANYRATLRLLYDTREIALGTIWDGGAGGDLGGSPGGHIGPHGFPQILLDDLGTLAGGMRNVYGNGVQSDIRGMTISEPQ